jgi:hypothetical protein
MSFLSAYRERREFQQIGLEEGVFYADVRHKGVVDATDAIWAQEGLNKYGAAVRYATREWGEPHRRAIYMYGPPTMEPEKVALIVGGMMGAQTVRITRVFPPRPGGPALPNM